jgi:hypothetical protein
MPSSFGEAQHGSHGQKWLLTVTDTANAKRYQQARISLLLSALHATPKKRTHTWIFPGRPDEAALLQ